MLNIIIIRTTITTDNYRRQITMMKANYKKD